MGIRGLESLRSIKSINLIEMQWLKQGTWNNVTKQINWITLQ